MVNWNNKKAVIKYHNVILHAHLLDTASQHIQWNVTTRDDHPVIKLDTQIVVPTARRGRITLKEIPTRNTVPFADALAFITDYMFSQQKLHNIGLGVKGSEEDFINAALATGFIIEGRRRDTIIQDECRRDLICLAMLECQQYAPRQNNVVPFKPRTPRPISGNLPPIPDITPAQHATHYGQRMRMRRKRPEDKDIFYSWFCRDEWWRGWMPQDPDGFKAPTRKQFEKNWQGTPAAHEWVVEALDGTPAGICFHHGLDRINRSAEANILLYDPAFWGQGIGTDAFHTLVKHMFDDLHLHRVQSATWNGNTGSLNVQLRSGLLIEVESHDSYFVDGKWYGATGTGLLEHEWRQMNH